MASTPAFAGESLKGLPKEPTELPGIIAPMALDHWEYIGVTESPVTEYVRSYIAPVTTTMSWSTTYTASSSQELSAKVEAGMEAAGANVSAEAGATFINGSEHQTTITFTRTEVTNVQYDVYQDFMYKYRVYKRGTELKHEYYSKRSIGSEYPVAR